MSRKFDRLVITAVIGAVCVTAAASLVSPTHKVTASPRVSFDVAKAESADRNRQRAGTQLASLEADINAKTEHNVVGLAKRFEKIGYDLDRVRDDGHFVPRIFLARLPNDLHAVPEVELKKTVFFKTMLPLVLQENERILKDRKRLIRLRVEKNLGNKLEARDRLWLAVLAERYKVKDDNINELLRRVDVVPPSLAMAQAAEESGWGTSRFAQVGNALFGQWTTAGGDGIVPEDRPDGMDHKVRKFGTLTQSVAAYMRNLNTHRAYREFRRTRQSDRRKGAALDGYDLAATLSSYSARGDEYISSIRSIIDANALRALDEAKLSRTALRDPAA